ncbi:sigma-54 interaction domain-containing protein [Colwellia marinimaniae]|uniref:Acetoacetate metabolism regulatory protein AtoC n=2 Tax=Colwellia TaxID=28228 RepID=A0ABQ0MZ30_9GAMM|nr:sigma-54 dependent transcriptional regulator [Colwellia marinimaniae]GAW97622.1 acetoacetate metabolism regulatory protein AtoC [Colwellia marinimaniae]
MTAVSVLLGEGVYNCKFFQSSKENKVELTTLPIDFSATYKKVAAARIVNSHARSPKVENAFVAMVANSPEMKDLVTKAKKLANSDLPTLVLGETGTGKEMLSQAIHHAGMRSDNPFKAVNCGALPESLSDSILFGHVKGSFTGADKDHQGLFEQASGGTLFSDEVGELSASIQVKLLRALQEGEITRVGDTNSRKVDVRVIAATHQNLQQMVLNGTFREDLFYRLAVGVLKIPALRQRSADIESLTQSVLMQVNQQVSKHPDFESKEISQDGINFIKQQTWPGNIRELWNTLSRAVLFSDNKILQAEDIKAALISHENKASQPPVVLSAEEYFDLPQHIDSIKRNYIEAALKSCLDSKTKAAKMLCLNNHQTLSNWLKESS